MLDVGVTFPRPSYVCHTWVRRYRGTFDSERTKSLSGVYMDGVGTDLRHRNPLEGLRRLRVSGDYPGGVGDGDDEDGDDGCPVPSSVEVSGVVTLGLDEDTSFHVRPAYEVSTVRNDGVFSPGREGSLSDCRVDGTRTVW